MRRRLQPAGFLRSRACGARGECNAASGRDTPPPCALSGVSHAPQLLGTPSLITDSAGSAAAAADLEDAYGGSGMVILTCKSGFLYNVYTCWDKADDGTVGDRIPCPSAVIANDASCPSDQIGIEGF